MSQNRMRSRTLLLGVGAAKRAYPALDLLVRRPYASPSEDRAIERAEKMRFGMRTIRSLLVPLLAVLIVATAAIGDDTGDASDANPAVPGPSDETTLDQTKVEYEIRVIEWNDFDVPDREVPSSTTKVSYAFRAPAVDRFAATVVVGTDECTTLVSEGNDVEFYPGPRLNCGVGKLQVIESARATD